MLNERVRVYTYATQPGNLGAWRLGTACRLAAMNPGGDPIDQGLALLKALQDEGYGIVPLDPRRSDF